MEHQAPPESDATQWEPAAASDRRPGSLAGWNILLGIDLSLIGLLLLGSIALVATDSLPDTAEGASPGALWVNVAINMLMFGVIPVVWLLGTRLKPLEGALEYLKLKRPGRSIALGVGLTGYPLAGVVVLSIVADVLGLAPEAGTEAFPGLTWPLAFAISAGAGIGEEILFRGILLPWVGIWGQAILFGLAHAANGWLGITFTLAFGLWAGYLVKRGWSLWALITAHALYDFVLLSMSLILGS